MTFFAQATTNDPLDMQTDERYFKSKRHRDAWVEEYKVQEALTRIKIANSVLLTIRRLDKNYFMERFKSVAKRSIEWYLSNEHRGFMDIRAMLIAATVSRVVSLSYDCRVLSINDLLSAVHANIRVAMETTAAHDWLAAYNVRSFVYDVYKELEDDYPNPKNPLVFNNYTLHDALKVFSLWAAVELGGERRYTLPGLSADGFLFHYKMYEEYRKDYEEALENWRKE